MRNPINAAREWLRAAIESVALKLRTAPKAMVLFFVTFAVVIALNPAKVGLVFYGVSKLALFAQFGRWVDGWVFPNAVPEALEGAAQGTAWKRRAWIVCASILAGSQLP